MANVIPILNEHIRRTARREARAETVGTKRLAAQFRRDIAAMKRIIGILAARVQFLEKRVGNVGVAAADVPENSRFRVDGLRSHRARLGLSAKDYGRLIGVSALTVYNWELGKSKPRKRQLASLLSIRGMGKREIIKRLAEIETNGA